MIWNDFVDFKTDGGMHMILDIADRLIMVENGILFMQITDFYHE